MTKQRLAARGMPKLKSGCRTCKRRHKKCDEARPACTHCSRAGFTCEFSNNPESLMSVSSIAGPRYPTHEQKLETSERLYLEYFRVVCASEIGLLLGLPLLVSAVVRQTYQHPHARHAAIAIGGLSYQNYFPGENHCATMLVAVKHYGAAMKTLHERLRFIDNGVTDDVAEAAVLGGIMLSAVAAFKTLSCSLVMSTSMMLIHVDGAKCILMSCRLVLPISLTTIYQLALHELGAQIDWFTHMQLRTLTL